MADYDTTGPHGITTCVNCLNDISGDIEGPYCSDKCRRQNESPRRSYTGTAEGCYPNPHVDETVEPNEAGR
jgi:hypothetical protein